MLYHRGGGGVRSIRKKPVGTFHYISINDPVSQSYIYQTPLAHDNPVSRTEYPKQPPYSVRDTISEALHELPGRRATIPVPAGLLKLKISQSSIIYHSFHKSIQTFSSPPVPTLLSKHEVQFIPNTKQTAMRYQAIPLQLLQNHTKC